MRASELIHRLQSAIDQNDDWDVYVGLGADEGCEPAVSVERHSTCFHVVAESNRTRDVRPVGDRMARPDYEAEGFDFEAATRTIRAWVAHRFVRTDQLQAELDAASAAIRKSQCHSA